MTKFIVGASELVFYQVEIEASSKEEARQIAFSGDVYWGNPVDGCDFDITHIKELHDEL